MRPRSVRRSPTTDRPRASARVAALRALAGRRLTAAKLHERLARRGYGEDEVRAAVASCARDGLLDDGLVATLHVVARHVPVGDARLVAELVRKGVDRETAAAAVREHAGDERERVDAALARLRRTHPALAPASLARRLERLGFPGPLIYRALRDEARAAYPELADLA